MADTGGMKEAIQSVIKSMMDRVMDRVLRTDPFIVEAHHAGKPLYAALVPDEIFKGAHFERRFVTPFGHVWEQVAKVVAEAAGARVLLGHAVQGNIGQERLRRIQEVLQRLEFPNRQPPRTGPDWAAELSYILAGSGPDFPVTVVCDLYVDGGAQPGRQAFEIKAPLPNSDQTKASKEKMLKLLSMSPRLVDTAYFALPYNPYGTKAAYSWSFPSRWFAMTTDPIVLIGDEFWNLVGGPGTYQAFVDAVNELGTEYKRRIYREFLGIEPPAGATDLRL
jgi:hypothetical protein